MNYYYLISSLPTLSIEDEYSLAELTEDIFELIERNLAPSDQENYRAILYQNDNRNFLNVIFREYHDFQFREFKTPSVLNREELIAYRRNSALLPGYMIDFLKDHSGVLGSYSLSEIEIKFNRYFKDYIDRLNNDFVKSYYLWQQQIFLLLSQVNQKQYGFLRDADVLTYDFGKASHFNITDQKAVKTELERLVQASRYGQLEKEVDRLYWSFADENYDIFSVNAVLAYVIKLLRVARWEKVYERRDTLREDFENCLNDLKKLDQSPKMSLV